MSHQVPPYSSTRLTAQLGLSSRSCLQECLQAGRSSTSTRSTTTCRRGSRPCGSFTSTWAGSIPFLLAKYGSTSIRFAGYYLGAARFKPPGPPSLVPRVLSPLLAADFFVLYFSGLYMLFHYYYTTTNIWPNETESRYRFTSGRR